MRQKPGVGTPATDRFKEFQEKLSRDFEEELTPLNGAFGNVKHGSIRDLKENFVDIMKKCMIPVTELQCTNMSGLISEIVGLDDRVNELEEETDMWKERVKDLEYCREKNEVAGLKEGDGG
jgi:hypothetical protein